MTANQVIKQIDHVNIRIADIEASLKFYTEILGFEYVTQRDMRPTANSVSTYVRHGGVVIELAWGHDLSKCAPAGIVDHFCLEVHDIREAMAYFKEKKVNIVSDIIPVNLMFLCFFITGPSGEKIEIIQYLSDET